MIIMEWSGKYAPEGAGFMYLCTVLMFVLHTTIINKIIIINIILKGFTISCKKF